MLLSKVSNRVGLRVGVKKVLLYTQATYDPILNVEKLQTFMPEVFYSLSSCYFALMVFESIRYSFLQCRNISGCKERFE